MIRIRLFLALAAAVLAILATAVLASADSIGPNPLNWVS